MINKNKLYLYLNYINIKYEIVDLLIVNHLFQI